MFEGSSGRSGRCVHVSVVGQYLATLRRRGHSGLKSFYIFFLNCVNFEINNSLKSTWIKIIVWILVAD